MLATTIRRPHLLSFFFFNDTATTEIYTLSLHDALPISRSTARERPARSAPSAQARLRVRRAGAPARPSRRGPARPRERLSFLRAHRRYRFSRAGLAARTPAKVRRPPKAL